MISCERNANLAWARDIYDELILTTISFSRLQARFYLSLDNLIQRRASITFWDYTSAVVHEDAKSVFGE